MTADQMGAMSAADSVGWKVARKVDMLVVRKVASKVDQSVRSKVVQKVVHLAAQKEFQMVARMACTTAGKWVDRRVVR